MGALGFCSFLKTKKRLCLACLHSVGNVLVSCSAVSVAAGIMRFVDKVISVCISIVLRKRCGVSVAGSVAVLNVDDNDEGLKISAGF